MIKHLFAIRDIKLDSYTKLLEFQNEKEAQRALSDVANDPNNMIGKHPEDFNLYYLGVWNIETGKFMIEEPRLVVSASDLIIKK